MLYSWSRPLNVYLCSVYFDLPQALNFLSSLRRFPSQGYSIYI